MDGYYGPAATTVRPIATTTNSNTFTSTNTINSKKIQSSSQSTHQTQQHPQHDAAKIFVGGLSWQTTEETLRYHFEQYGEVVSVEVMRDRNTGDPRGFAFVVFREDATVELVMSNAPHEVNHKTVDVKRAQARGSAPPSIHHEDGSVSSGIGSSGGGVSTGHHRNKDGSLFSTAQHPQQQSQQQSQQHSNQQQPQLTPEQLQNKIFVGGLPLHLDHDGLWKFFESYGKVVDAIVMMDPITQRRSRGFGFVTFENGSGGAQKAMKNQPIHIGEKYVEIKLATPKGDAHGGGGGGHGNNQHSKSGGNNAHQFHRGGLHQNNASNVSGNPAGLRNPNAIATSTSQGGEFAGLAASYGRSGWKAGFPTVAFGPSGWNVKGWEIGNNDAPAKLTKTGFSFQMLDSESKKQVIQNHTSDKNNGIEKRKSSSISSYSNQVKGSGRRENKRPRY